MTAVRQAALLNSHPILRSALRPEQPTREPEPPRQHQHHPWLPALQLVGHMAATTFIFTSFVTLVWLASCTFSFLHSVHPFSDDACRLFETMESLFIRIDAALSGVVLLRGLWLYVFNIIRSES